MHSRSVLAVLILAACLVLTACNDSAATEATRAAAGLTATARAVALQPPAPTQTAVPTIAPPDTLTPQPTQTPTVTHTPTATGTPTSTASPSATPTPTETPTPSVTPTSTPEPPPWSLLPWYWDPANYAPSTPPPPLPARPDVGAAPGAPVPYLSRYRLIGFYGSPEGRGLGILGNQFRNETVRMLRATIREYQPYVTDGRYSMPLFHMITTVAKPCSSYPTCSYQVDKLLIYDWIVTADNNSAAIILDIQAGRADLMSEFARVREFLYFPHVHLAVDPEFLLSGEQEPNRQIGTIDAAQINALQAEMNQIALEVGVNRVLVIHQFKDSMITNKQDIINYPHVELVINGDGYGPPGPKIRNYLQYAAEPGFEYGGFKLFSDQVNFQLIYDVPFMLPERVMTVLVPQPVIIMYQ